jgi:hypothetical protein
MLYKIKKFGLAVPARDTKHPSNNINYIRHFNNIISTKKFRLAVTSHNRSIIVIFYDVLLLLSQTSQTVGTRWQHLTPDTNATAFKRTSKITDDLRRILHFVNPFTVHA